MNKAFLLFLACFFAQPLAYALDFEPVTIHQHDESASKNKIAEEEKMILSQIAELKKGDECWQVSLCGKTDSFSILSSFVFFSFFMVESKSRDQVFTFYDIWLAIDKNPIAKEIVSEVLSKGRYNNVLGKDFVTALNSIRASADKNTEQKSRGRDQGM